MTRIPTRRAAALLFLAFSLHAGAALAADLKVLSTIALTDAWHELKPMFEARGQPRKGGDPVRDYQGTTGRLDSRNG